MCACRCLIVAVMLSPGIVLADAETPDAGRSAAAVKALEAEIQTARSGSVAALADKDFAKAPLTKADAARARSLIADSHAAYIRATRAGEVKDRVLKEGKLAMPFFYKTFGAKPWGGRSLWILMHGGGNAPAYVNDSQYENQKRLYELAEGIYLAPRAPPTPGTCGTKGTSTGSSPDWSRTSWCWRT